MDVLVITLGSDGRLGEEARERTARSLILANAQIMRWFAVPTYFLPVRETSNDGGEVGGPAENNL
jgi:hypothetical protein